jgi:CheY-like chemotaxis protein
VPHKLLLADDSVTIQRVIELTFADEDVQVIAVGNGADAIERAQRDRPDIVLADVGMPERNGYEVAAFIKGTPSLAHIPVVLLTGAFEPVDEQRARSVGCDGVLVKPFEPQLVINRVKELLAGKQPAGMWSGPPPAAGEVRPATAPGVQGRTGASSPSPHESLEAYFDHLDAAFGTASESPARPASDPIPLSRRPVTTEGTSSQGTSAKSNDPFADWDPDLQGDPSKPAPVDPPLAFPTKAPAPPQSPAPRVSTPPPAPVAAPLQIPSLIEAFAALLSAEQKIGLTASSAAGIPPAAGAPALSEQMIDDITSRVLARLSSESRPAILDVAERLVREEIERIKSIG